MSMFIIISLIGGFCAALFWKFQFKKVLNYFNKKTCVLTSERGHPKNMNFIPSQSLSRLICVNCKKYLSHFPIYFHPEKGSFCGRCPKPDDPNTVQNEIYELVAQTQKFPCCYNSNGCLENLVPSKIPHHEKYCPYIIRDCPTLPFMNCKWQGFTNELPEHFEKNHPTFFLKDGQFELDFVNSYVEHCILPFGEDLFVVTRSNDSNTNTFSCNVSYIGANSSASEYTYKIILENEKKSHARAITNKLNVKSDINIDSVRSILNNPSSVIATVEVLEYGDVTENVTNPEEDDEQISNDVNYELMKELECLVCFEYMLPPIHQCLTGHSICLKCKNNVDKCPTCEQEFQNTQNYTLAQILNYITYPCKNKRCKFTTKAKDIKQHEASCIYGSVKCPLQEYKDCHADMIFSEIYDHIVDHHYENILQIETVSIPFEISEDLMADEDCYILKYGFRLFKMHYKYQDCECIWAMQLIGPAEESVKYMFEIDVIDNSGNNCRAYFKELCSPLSDSSTAFHSDNSFIFIKYDQIKYMITTDFTYRVRILEA